MSISGPQFGAMTAGPMGSNSYVTPDGTQHHDSHVAGPGFEQHEHSTFRHTVNGQPAGGPAFPSMGASMGGAGFGGGSSFHQSSAGSSSSFQQGGYHSGPSYDMGVHHAHSLAPPPPPAPSAFGNSFGASSAAGSAWSAHSQSRNSFDSGFHGHHGADSMMSARSGAMLPSSGIGGGLTGPQFGPLSTSGPSGVQEYTGADGSHHREVHQAGPGFEHHEHSSSKHTVNGHPVNATAPMGPPAGMGQFGSLMGGSNFGGGYGGHSSTWGSAWEGGSSSFQRTASF